MVRQRPEVEALLAGAEEAAAQVRRGSGAFEHRLDPDPRETAAERDVNHLEARIATEMQALVSELPGLLAPLLQRDVADVGAFLEEDLGGPAGKQHLLPVVAQESPDLPDTG